MNTLERSGGKQPVLCPAHSRSPRRQASAKSLNSVLWETPRLPPPTLDVPGFPANRSRENGHIPPSLLQTGLRTLSRKSYYLLVSQGVHVANNLCCHLPSVCRAVLEGSLDYRHDERQGRGVNEVNKLGVQQGLQAFLGLP